MPTGNCVRAEDQTSLLFHVETRRLASFAYCLKKAAVRRAFENYMLNE